MTPSALNGAVAVIVNAAANLTVTLPQYLGSGFQLYLIVTNGNLTLTDLGAATPVFAYGSGTVTLAGTTIVGQVVGGNITATAPTNLIAQSVSTIVGTTPTFPPDFSFPAVVSGLPPPASYLRSSTNISAPRGDSRLLVPGPADTPQIPDEVKVAELPTYQ